MTENEFILQDRIGVIKSIDKKYDLNKNAYISFSGGKDSTILHYLVDMALPNNQIPRVFADTGIEYQSISLFVRERERRFPIYPNQAIFPCFRDVEKIRIPI